MQLQSGHFNMFSIEQVVIHLWELLCFKSFAKASKH